MVLHVRFLSSIASPIRDHWSQNMVVRFFRRVYMGRRFFHKQDGNGCSQGDSTQPNLACRSQAEGLGLPQLVLGVIRVEPTVNKEFAIMNR